MLRRSGLDSKVRGVPSHLNPVSKGLDEDLFLLHFNYRAYRRAGGDRMPGMRREEKPVFLGWDFFDFSQRFHRGTGERGLSRKYVIADDFMGIDAEPLDLAPFEVDPRSPHANWQRVLMPVVAAEGLGDYLVVNSFDKAGMTVGFIQMAAHTPNDLIPMMRHLIGSERLRSDEYANPERWFPELGLTAEGKLGYRVRPGGELVSIEEPTVRSNGNEGFRRSPWWAGYYREDFVRFCNPDVKVIDDEELHFAARWLMWSLSPKMREEQLEPVKENVVWTLQQLKQPGRKISGAAMAICVVLLHWNDGAESQKRVKRLLQERMMYREFLSLESREGDASAVRYQGTLIAKQKPWFRMTIPERKVLNRRIGIVRELFEREPRLLRELLELEFDFDTGELRKK